MYTKNYETQIMKYERFANIYEMQNVQCKICVKFKIHEAQNGKLQNMYKNVKYKL